MDQGVSRRYVASNLSVAKWLEQRQRASTLNILLVVNPTQDLPGTEAEGRRIRELFTAEPSMAIHELRGAQATKPALLDRFRSGEYDVIHYAGHAFFDSKTPARSGIRCLGRAVLSGADLAGISNLPSLVFLNACEAGRVREPSERNKNDVEIEKRIERSVGLAEAFLRGGVANYLGTYWPVREDAAETFARTFYTRLLERYTIGAALIAGRANVCTELQSIDWVDYLHYGSYDFALKQG